MTKPDTTPRTLVLGLGKTGASVVEFLCARGERVTAADSRDLAPGLAMVRKNYPQVKVITGGLPLDDAAFLKKFHRVVVSPGVVVGESTVAGDLNLIGDIELFAQHATAPVIAVTGSNGKSSVVTLVGEMLHAAGKRALTGGNLGTPALALLKQPRPDFYVLELSSFQLEATHSLTTAASAILNISADHLDRYATMDDYAAAKRKILCNAGVQILNRDDAVSQALLTDAAVTFGVGRPERDRDYGVADAHLCRGDHRLAAVADITAGAQNILNILVAFALLDAAGVSVSDAAVTAAVNWRGLPHRCEFVASVGGVNWINDSKGTNVGATVAAIKSVGDDGDDGDDDGANGNDSGDIILIAGGVGKGADFAPLAAPVGARVKHAVLFGQDADEIETAINGVTDIIRARDLNEAVTTAATVAEHGQAVLFSPACASFDMFTDYQQRGDAFKKLVAALEKKT